jgi:hypothetical protein
MLTTWQDIIDRARTYVSDDHDEDKGWITPERWLTLANVEYGILYKRWVRMGLIRIEPNNNSFAGPGTVIPGDTDPEGSGVLCIIGVAEDLGGGRFRLIPPGQSVDGADAFYDELTTGPAVRWRGYGVGDSIRIFLSPYTSDGQYMVRWIPAPIPQQNAANQVEMPFGCDERLVLGTARRALLKDSSASALLERLIAEQDAETNFSAFGKNNSDGPRVRRVRSIAGPNRRWSSGFPHDPQGWSYY